MYNAFMPMIDGITLTDSMNRLYQAGKVVDVPVIVGSVTDEGGFYAGKINSTLSVATNEVWNLTESQVAEAITYYPINATFGFSSPDNVFLTEFHAFISSISQFGEGGCAASERMIGRYMGEIFGSERIWAYRFNAPCKSCIAFLPRFALTLLTSTQWSEPTTMVAIIHSPTSCTLQRTPISRHPRRT